MKRTLYEDVHGDFRASFRTFLEREVLGDEGRYGEWERNGIVPREVFALAGSGGFLGMAVPERYGGASAEDFRFNLVIGEETQRAGVGGFGLGITLHNDICLPYFLTYCNEEQRERWLPGIASGELITALAMTEPGIGSDLANLSTRARREGENYAVDGTKTFITNGINADLVIVAVKTGVGGHQERHRGISLLVVERGTEGFERGRNLEKIGQHSQDTAELSFSDMHVPVENLLGEEGEGFRYLVSNLPQERLSIAASAVGGGRSGIGLDARLRARAPGLRSADRLVSELALYARRGEHRNRDRAYLRRPLHAGSERGRSDSRGRGDGEVVVHRPAGPRRRSLPAAARRVRLYDGVPDRARLCGRARHTYIWRGERDHEGDHRSFAGAVNRSASETK